MCADAGMTVDQTAKALHVTTRTVRYWISGRVAIPYAAYRLMRILGRYELPDSAWSGWVMHSGRLWSPEGHGFIPHDSNWWSLLVRKARFFSDLYERQRQFDVVMLRAGRTQSAADCADKPQARRGPEPVEPEPLGAAGRAAQPGGRRSRPALIYY